MKTMKIVLSFSLLPFAVIPTSAEKEDVEWIAKNGKQYWMENGEIQGAYGDPKNIKVTQYNRVKRGRKIYDSSTDAWYWLDVDNEVAKAVSKEVWIPYVYQDEKPGFTDGKWVRYDENGKMIGGWYADGAKVYCYDLITGAMAKGNIRTITWNGYRENPDNMEKDLAYGFDATLGILAYDAGYSYCSGDPGKDHASSLFFINGHDVSRTRATFLLSSESPGLFLGAYEKVNVPFVGWHFRLTDDDWENAKQSEWILYLDTKGKSHTYEPVFVGVSSITEKEDEIVFYDCLDYSGLDQSLLYLCHKTSERQLEV